MHLKARVVDVTPLCPGIKRYALMLPSRLMSRPGQFVMVWLPGAGEVPISVAGEEGRRLQLIIAGKGRVTTLLHESVQKGSVLRVRGPLGRGFKVKGGRALLVAGGYGAAPLLYLASALLKAGGEVTVLIGFKSRRYAILVEDFRRLGCKVFIATEDGSLGFKGLVTDLAARLLGEGVYDVVYTCGREAMMVKVVQAAMKAGVEVQASLERLIKCGLGLCGACAMEPLGLRVCVDGPVFDGSVLERLQDFGRWWRDASGRKVPLPP